jgi:hypothetical protein
VVTTRRTQDAFYASGGRAVAELTGLTVTYTRGLLDGGGGMSYDPSTVKRDIARNLVKAGVSLRWVDDEPRMWCVMCVMSEGRNGMLANMHMGQGNRAYLDMPRSASRADHKVRVCQSAVGGEGTISIKSRNAMPDICACASA